MIEFSWDAVRRARQLKTSVTLPCCREELFDFFSDAFQLERITPPWLNFPILTSAPIEIQPGALIDYKLRLRGLPIRWRTEISQWDPPCSFVDRQIKGPYLLWEHRHTFEQTDDGTIVADTVHYRVPGGALVDRLFIQKELRRIFQYREDQMLKIFGTPTNQHLETAKR